VQCRNRECHQPLDGSGGGLQQSASSSLLLCRKEPTSSLPYTAVLLLAEQVVTRALSPCEYPRLAAVAKLCSYMAAVATPTLYLYFEGGSLAVVTYRHNIGIYTQSHVASHYTRKRTGAAPCTHDWSLWSPTCQQWGAIDISHKP
jgi:hypothetical protein